MANASRSLPAFVSLHIRTDTRKRLRGRRGTTESIAEEAVKPIAAGQIAKMCAMAHAAAGRDRKKR